MLRFALALIPLVTLAACEDAAPAATRAAAIPFQSILAENSMRPWECLGYDRATDSCVSLSRTTRNGMAIISEGGMAGLDGLGGAYRVVGRGRIDAKGRACFRPEDQEISVAQGRPTREETVVFEATKEILNEIGETCTAYFRNGDHYIAEARTLQGELMPFGRMTVHFFEQPKKLRALGG